MTIRNPSVARVARDLLRALALLSAFMLALSALDHVRVVGSTPAGAATRPGEVTLSPASGSAAPSFSLHLPPDAACTGDTATGGYRVRRS